MAGSLRPWRTARRDAGGHASPNAGWPEAAMAGALGVQLGGLNSYDGHAVETARLGDPTAPLTPARLRRALRLTAAVNLLALLLGAAFLWRLHA